MSFLALANLVVAGVRPPQEGERVGSEGHRRRQSGERSDKREPGDEAHGPHPVLNTQGETTGKLIDTQA